MKAAIERWNSTKVYSDRSPRPHATPTASQASHDCEKARDIRAGARPTRKSNRGRIGGQRHEGDRVVENSVDQANERRIDERRAQ